MSKKLVRCKPEEAGVSSCALRSLVSCLDRYDQVHSFMVLRHGRVIGEGWWAPYGPEHAHHLFSLSKSFTSIGVGLCVDDGLLGVDDLVSSHLGDLFPAEVSSGLSGLRVRDLLRMSTGHGSCEVVECVRSGVVDWARHFLSLPMEASPGEVFMYESLATVCLSVLVTRVTGLRLGDFLTFRLFEPLGLGHPRWDSCPLGYSIGAWGLFLRTEDLAVFGQFLLQGGIWEGRRLLSESWISAATSCQIATSGSLDWGAGYGYQFWRCAFPGAYRADGAFGQICLVMPEQDMVVAVTAGVEDMQGILSDIWVQLGGSELSSGAFPADLAAQSSLSSLCGSLAVHEPRRSGLHGAVELSQSVVFEGNSEGLLGVSLSFADAGCALVVSWRGGLRHVLGYGRDHWRLCSDSWDSRYDGSRSGGQMFWQSGHRLLLRSWGLECPFRVDLELLFTESGGLRRMKFLRNFDLFGLSVPTTFTVSSMTPC